ncbi:hypothetical protein [Exiguobacterium sp.]|uniref:hypothetical protein n=1 Tax=Exiguobacterium sp. TaxID=44751 RepID=UPI0028ACCFC2|nr:hypothetical protein [Exiguobacterium sp.]
MTNDRHLQLQNELKKELIRMQTGNSNYRKKTAQNALMLSQYVNIPESLRDRKTARHYVKTAQLQMHEDQIEDVAKMMSMAARRVYNSPESTFSEDMKVKLEKKRNRFKAFGLRVKS